MHLGFTTGDSGFLENSRIVLYPLYFHCPVNGNYVSTMATPAEVLAPSALETEAFALHLDCSEVSCQSIPDGVQVEAMKPFITECVGGRWYSNPAPEFNDRWTVNQSPL
jgi:hypothetical protein